MRFGCFGHTADIDTIARAGFDSAELDLMEISRMAPDAFVAFKKRAMHTGLTFDAFSGYMPLTERIHASGFRFEPWFAHTRLCAERTRELGAVLWPMGAGKCRSIPDDCTDVPAAKERVKSFFGGIAGILNEYGIMLAIEPLGPPNSNFLQTIGETAEFANGIGLPNCRIMCDLRHMLSSGDSYQAIAWHRDLIVHAHIDYPLGTQRYFPKDGDAFDYKPYLSALKTSGYSRLLTVEATAYEDLSAEASHSVRYLKQLWNEV